MSRVYGHYNCFKSSIAGTVSRRQIMTSKDGPRAVNVNWIHLDCGWMALSNHILRDMLHKGRMANRSGSML